MHPAAHQHNLFFERGGVVGDIQAYLFGVVAAGMICSIAQIIGPQKGVNRNLIKTLCGTFVLLSFFAPILEISYTDFDGILPDYSASGQTAAEQGESFAREALEAGIKCRTEAYILDKAESYDARLEVEVKIEWKDTPVPVGVVISGNCSPYAKSQLSAMMEQDLGIPPSEQEWIKN